MFLGGSGVLGCYMALGLEDHEWALEWFDLGEDTVWLAAGAEAFWGEVFC